MLVVCPKCSSSYLVRADQIGTLGRAVRCGACKTNWVAMPDAFDTGEELDLDTTMRMSEPELSADELAAANASNSAARSNARGKDVVISRTMQIVAIVLAIVALGAVALSISDVRTQVNVALAGITSVIAVDENAGLTFNELKSEYIEENGKAFLKVDGQIMYDRAEPRKMPPIEVIVRSEGKQELKKWVIDPPADTISAGTPVPFKALLAEPPPDSKEVAIRFGSM